MKLTIVSFFTLLCFSFPAFAQETSKDAKTAEKVEKGKEEAKDSAKEKVDERKSEDGAYEWQMSFGAGFDIGLWFADYERLESCNSVEDACYLNGAALNPDKSVTWNFDLVLEASLLEGTRLSLFGGVQTPFGSNPSITALYGGIEPAFAFRRGMWEIALGIGIGFGGATMEYDSGEKLDANITLLRPFIELRRYINTFMAVYGRFGFNEWIINNPELTNLELVVPDHNLNTGGLWFSIGARFGHYPLHTKEIGDKDNDGLKDDIDDCPEEPEDMDGFQDDDGCPETDNDGDGILDAVDKCPMEPEDKDGWMDEDGCPESDDDLDGDGILNAVDKCPNDPEDKDGFEDEDGCPDIDNDGDGILDVDDKCPMEKGVPEKAGCPFRLVEVTEEAIVINEKVFFELNKAKIQEQSFPLLNEVAKVLNENPRIKKVEVQGHTDHAGSANYNKKLSSRRAKSVLDYLVAQAVDPARLTSQGLGFDQPLVPLPDNKKETKEGAEQNRRVEFKILEQEKLTKTVREDKVPEKEAPKEAPKSE